MILLQALFRQLLESSLGSVTPETELAYLALVTSNTTSNPVATANPTSAADLRNVASDAPPPLEPVTLRNNTPQPEMDGPTTTNPFSSHEAEAVAIPDFNALKSPSVLGKRRSSALEAIDQAGTSLDELALASSPPPKASEEEAVGPILATEPVEVDGMSVSPTIGSTTPTPEAGESLGMDLDDDDDDGDGARVKRGKSTDQSTPPLFDSAALLVPLATDGGDIVVSGEGALAASGVEAEQDGALPVLGPAPPPLPIRPNPVDLEQEVSKAMAFGLQNDVTEAQDNVVFLIEASQGKRANDEDANDKGVVKSTFYGQMKQLLEFDNPNAVPDPVRTTKVPFLSLGVRVSLDPPGVTSTRSLYDGLDSVFEATAVTSEGHAAQLRSTLLETPQMLQIQLQRVDYDREERRVVKSNAHVAFPEVLVLDRYLDVDPADEGAVARQHATRAKWQEFELARLRLEMLGKDTDQPIDESLRHLREWLSGEYVRTELKPTDRMLTGLAEEADKAEAEMVQLVERMVEIKCEIDDVWRGQRQAQFGLAAVFIHRGTASSGHYYVYLKNREDGLWYKYNDATITPVEKSEVFRQASEGAKADTNAYFLGYEKLPSGADVSEEQLRVGGPREEVAEEEDMGDTGEVEKMVQDRKGEQQQVTEEGELPSITDWAKKVEEAKLRQEVPEGHEPWRVASASRVDY